MNGILYGLLAVLLAAVAIVLLLGLISMFRGDKPGRSQILMRWRVALQFAALLVALGAAWYLR